MKLNEEQLAVISRYTDACLIDQERLIAYLERHRTIKGEVFSSCSRINKRSFDSRGYCSFLDEEPVFTPVDRDTFIRRIPFYFFQVPMGEHTRSGLSKVIPLKKGSATAAEYEMIYQDLEWLFYDLCLSLEDIFNYASDQLSTPALKDTQHNLDAPFRLTTSKLHEPGISPRTLFTQWCDYLHICEDLGWTDYLPERFITRYNQALEAVGREPIIYRPLTQYSEQFLKDDNVVTCRGNFPCDKSGMPVLRWTSLKIAKPAALSFSAQKSCAGELRIQLGPLTTIHSMEPSGPEENISWEWVQIYAGPQTMLFDHEALKQFRLTSGMTQKAVADAIGASVRTYQKWENGETTPDGHYLLRIMNWLNIDSVQHLTRYLDIATQEV